jgi:S1-C subfamily serine protease
MKFLTIFALFYFLCSNYSAIAQSTPYKMVFNEQFENNINGWKLFDDAKGKAIVSNGKLIHEAYLGHYAHRFNLLKVDFNSSNDYFLKFSIANLNYFNTKNDTNIFTLYGFVWNYIDVNNYSFITFSQNYLNGNINEIVTNYAIGEWVDGQLMKHQVVNDDHVALNTETSFNEILISKRDGYIYFYKGKNELIANLLGKCPTDKWNSNKCGSYSSPGSKVVLDYLTIEEKVSEVERAIAAKKIESSSGSGIIITTDGYITTNYHVVEGGEDFKVDLYENGLKKTYKAELVKIDKTNDLAVLKITDVHFKKLPILPYGVKTTGVRVGAKVFAMGYPLISYQGNEVKVTDGIISANTGYQDDPTTYQISVPIQPGNSGGPLFDMNGNLIGITNAGIQSAQNVGYSIKASYLMNFLETITAIPKPKTQSTLIGKSLPDIIDKLKPYTVLVRVNDK